MGWHEVNAAGLPDMFQMQRKIFAEQLTQRFKLDTTPDRHTLLALKMHPEIDTSADGWQLHGKQAKRELMDAEYTRALRRQAMLQEQRNMRPTVHMPRTPVATRTAETPVATPTAETPVATPTAAAAPTATPTPPLVSGSKKHKGRLGSAISAQKRTIAPTENNSRIDITVKAEMDKFSLIKEGILSRSDDEALVLTDFWAEHKAVLPLHFGVYVSEVGCKKAASANVETVFSGAGKFTEEAKSTGPTLLRRMVKLHYNWKYTFLRPSIEQVIRRYKEKWPGQTGKVAAMAAMAQKAAAQAAEAADAEAAAAEAADAEESE